MPRDDNLLDDDKVMAAPAAGAPAQAVLRHLAQLRDGLDAELRDHADIARHLSAAIAALAALPPATLIDSAAARAARDHLAQLRDALANLSRGGPDDPARALDAALFEPSRAWAAIARACGQFAAPGDADATFSLILFRRADAGGAIARSFDTERSSPPWISSAPRARRDEGAGWAQ